MLSDEAHNIDAELDRWYATLPECWQPQVIAAYAALEEDNPQDAVDIYPGPIHGYSSPTKASTIAQYRMFRIYTNGVIARCALAISDNATFTSACNAIRNLVDDICASSAYFLGYHVPEVDGPLYSDGIRYVKTSDLFRDTSAPLSSSLSWPLFVARSAECIPTSQRDWIERCLKVLGEREGLGQVQLMGHTRPGLIEGSRPWYELKAQVQ